MGAPLKEWTVLPHGDLVEVDDGIWSVVGEMKMPIGHLPRRMTVVRMQDGRLIIFSAIALDDFEMERLEGFGTPAFLIVPNDHHRFDARIWKDRYPAIHVIAPEGAKEKVSKIVPVDATSGGFNGDPIRLVNVAGTRLHEVALEVTRESGVTLILNDVMANVRGAHGFSGWMLKLMGFAGDEPHVPGPVKMAIVDDKHALAAHLRQWAETPNLKRIIVSHGDMIEHDPAGALRDLAATLE